MKLSTAWQEATFVAFDIETSGQYPVQSEICELGATKWGYKCGQAQVLDKFESFISVSSPMTQEIINIHNITNKMLVGAPKIGFVLEKFSSFSQGAVFVAHHAPFDMGFLAYAFEQNGLPFPEAPVFCTSLLSRRLMPESSNHKLGTLAKHLNIESKTLHRALDDSDICRHVMHACILRAGKLKKSQAEANVPPLSLEQLFLYQKGGAFRWEDFSVHQLLKQRPEFECVLQAIRQQSAIHLVYKKGEAPYSARQVQPIGLALRPQEAFVAAWPSNDVDQKATTNPTTPHTYPKRYYLDKIVKCY